MQHSRIYTGGDVQQMGSATGGGTTRESGRQEGSHDKNGSIDCLDLQAVDRS